MVVRKSVRMAAVLKISLRKLCKLISVLVCLWLPWQWKCPYTFKHDENSY